MPPKLLRTVLCPTFLLALLLSDSETLEVKGVAEAIAANLLSRH